MAAENIRTTLQFQADITDFKAAMQESNRAIRLANSEFAAASSGMDNWASSTEGLQAKLRQLATVQAAQEQKLAALRAEYDKVVAAEGESSQAAQELAIKINQQQAAVNKTGQEIKTYTGKLDDAEKATDDLGDATKQAGGAAKEYADDLDEPEQATLDLADASEKASGVVTGALAAIGAACVAVVAGFLSMAESSREYRVAMGKIGTAFEDVGMSADMGKQLYMDFYAVLGDQDKAVEAISNLALLTDDQKALSEWTTIATGVYAKFGDALPIESLTEAANETAKTGALTGALADALNWAGVSEEEFQASLDACTTTQEREALIRETLNGLYADAGEKYREVNADIIASNEAQARMTDAMAQLGAKAEPIMTAIQNGFAAIAEAAASLLTDMDMEGITAAIENAFSWFIDTAVPAITNAISWVIDNSGLILGLVTGIATGFAAWKVTSIVTSAVTAISSLTKALQAASTGQKALNSAMKANIIGIIITLVAELVAGFIYLWNNCEEFRNFFINMWKGIKSFFAGIVDWFGKAGKSIANYFADAWNKIKAAFSPTNVRKFFDGVLQKITGVFSSVGSWFGNVFSKAWQGIKNAFSNVGSFFSSVWEKITGVFSIDGMLSIGKNLVSGLWDGISSSFTWIKDKITGWVGNVMDFIKGLFGIHSPSTVMRDEVGKMLGAGMAEGITDSRAAVNGAVRRLSDAALDGLARPSSSVPAAATGKTIVFNQTNNSPKALTRREIYRQTFNALSYAGGV